MPELKSAAKALHEKKINVSIPFFKKYLRVLFGSEI
jgi:hypothetical protein